MIILLIAILLFVIYALLMLYYWRSWVDVPYFQRSGNEVAGGKISVIIPARNEEKNIGVLLDSLQEQDFPAEYFEVIVIDDHSTDNTAGIVQRYPAVKLIRLQEEDINSYKKKAIEKAIEIANGELIITTDADCVASPGWLSAIAAFRQETNAVFIVAPVSYDCNSSVVQVFQAMDFMVLQGITGASVHKRFLNMCNGANLAYDRSAYMAVGGFAGIDNIASGDDMLLMQKISEKYPDRIAYLKSQEAIVQTRPAESWKEFLNQRIRWASKATYYKDAKLQAVLVLVYLFNLLFLFLFVAGFFNYYYWFYLLGLWFAKTMVEYPFFISVSTYFSKPWAIPYFFIFQPLHILYTILAGFLGIRGKYQWKGRRVR